MNALILILLFSIALAGDWIFSKTGACIALVVVCVVIWVYMHLTHMREKWEHGKERKEFDESEIYK